MTTVGSPASSWFFEGLRIFTVALGATHAKGEGLAFLNFIFKALPLVLGLIEGKRARDAEKDKQAEIDAAEEKSAGAYRDKLRTSGRSQGSVESSGGSFETALKQVTGV
ncbi:MAG: hypothetical protein AAFQ58_19195 [Pseudomonadota bacterium]